MCLKKTHLNSLILICIIGNVVNATSIIDLGFTIYAKESLLDEKGNIYFRNDVYDYQHSGWDYLTIKYDKEATSVWERRFNSPGNGSESSEAFTIDSQANVYVTGDSIDYDKKTFSYATVKYNTLGNEIWTTFYKEPNDDLKRISDITVNNNGSVYITAPIEVQIPGTTSSIDKYRYSLIIKYNSEGKLSWTRKYGESENYEQIEPYDIDVDKSGNVYIVSHVTGKKTGRWSIKEANNYFATVKHSTNGEHQWTVLYAADVNTTNIPSILTCDSLDNVYVIGSSVNEDSGYADLVTIKYDKDGKQQWLAHYRNPASKDIDPADMCLDKSGNVYVACHIHDPNDEPYSMSSLNTEFVVIKYDKKGVKEWLTKYDAGEGHQWWRSSLIIDAEDSVYLKGFILDRDIKNEKSDEEVGEESMRVGVLIKYDNQGNSKWVQRFYNIQELVKLLSKIPINPNSCN